MADFREEMTGEWGGVIRIAKRRGWDGMGRGSWLADGDRERERESRGEVVV